MKILLGGVGGNRRGDSSPDEVDNPLGRLRIVGSGRIFTVTGTAEARIAAIAERQHGVVNRRQLLAAGLTGRMIDTRLERGQLRPLYRGVYATGHLSELTHLTAALLVCGSGAVISHLSAFNLWALSRSPHSLDAVSITVTGSVRGRAQRGIAFHRSGILTPPDIRRHQGLPVTSPERTIIDTTPLLTDLQLERAVDEAIARRVTSHAKLLRRTRALSGPPRRLLAVLADRRGGVPEPGIEEMLLSVIREAGLAEPVLHAQLHGFSVDFYWPKTRFAVECDSLQWHNNKTNFSRDRRKERVLADSGIKLSRVTWDQVRHERLELVAHLARHAPAA